MIRKHASLLLAHPPLSAGRLSARSGRPLRHAGVRGADRERRAARLAWRAGGHVIVDETVFRSGRAAGRLHRDVASAGNFSAFTLSIPVQFEGRALELRGFVRTEDVTGFAGLWMREDAVGGTVAFDNMQDRPVRGTTDWVQYRIELPLHALARDVFFGMLLQGEGTVWVDDLEFLVDGVPITEVPRIQRGPTILETDTEFADGSGIELTEFAAEQVEHLAVLGQVCGLLKYHHPRIAAGELHWDFELFRVLPAVLEAAGAAERNRALVEWAERRAGAVRSVR